MATNDLSKLSDEELERKAREWKPKQLTKPVKKDLSKLSDEELLELSKKWSKPKVDTFVQQEQPTQESDYSPLRTVARVGRAVASLPGDYIDNFASLLKLGSEGIKTARDYVTKPIKEIPVVGEYINKGLKRTFPLLQTPEIVENIPSFGNATRKGIDYLTNDYAKPKNATEQFQDQLFSEVGTLFGPGAVAKPISKFAPKVANVLQKTSLAPTQQNIAGVAGGIGAREAYLHNNEDPGLIGAIGSNILGSAIARNPKQFAQNTITGAKDLYTNAREQTQDFLAKYIAKKYDYDLEAAKIFQENKLPYSLPQVSKNSKEAFGLYQAGLKSSSNRDKTHVFAKEQKEAIRKKLFGDQDRVSSELLSESAPYTLAKSARNMYNKQYEQKIKGTEHLDKLMQDKGLNVNDILVDIEKNILAKTVNIKRPEQYKDYIDTFNNSPVGKAYNKLKHIKGEKVIDYIESSNSPIPGEIYEAMNYPDANIRNSILKSLEKKHGKDQIQKITNEMYSLEGKVSLENIKEEIDELMDAIKKNTASPDKIRLAKNLGRQLTQRKKETARELDPKAARKLEKADKFWTDYKNYVFEDDVVKTQSKKPGIAQILDQILTTKKEEIDTIIKNPQVMQAFKMAAKNKDNKEKAQLVFKDIVAKVGSVDGNISLPKFTTYYFKLKPSHRENLLSLSGMSDNSIKSFDKLLRLTKKNKDIETLVTNTSGSAPSAESFRDAERKISGFGKAAKSLAQKDISQAAAQITFPFIMTLLKSYHRNLTVDQSFLKRIERILESQNNPRVQANHVKNLMNDKRYEKFKDQLIANAPTVKTTEEKKRNKPITIRPSDAEN